ncbi:MAG TPA: hypothetical protein VI757_01455 [Bacteroidia bacterium]|nr:hypothetical protein [Bacteroidia bacterium]
MKKVNTYLMSAAIVLISVLSISIGAAAIRNMKAKSESPVIIKRECTSNVVGLTKYKGEWISVIELPEVTIVEYALKKSK